MNSDIAAISLPIQLFISRVDYCSTLQVAETVLAAGSARELSNGRRVAYVRQREPIISYTVKNCLVTMTHMDQK